MHSIYYITCLLHVCNVSIVEWKAHTVNQESGFTPVLAKSAAFCRRLAIKPCSG